MLHGKPHMHFKNLYLEAPSPSVAVFEGDYSLNSAMSYSDSGVGQCILN